MTSYRKQLGKAGEEIAKEYLLAKGYSLLEANFRCWLGEIDLILEADNQLIFVEVKTRRSLKYGLPEESVNFRKQMKIRKVAEYYLSYNKKYYTSIRFDVITIILSGTKSDKIEINHIEAAF